MRLFDLCVAKKLSGGGGNSQFTGLVQRTITTASDSEAQSIGIHAFWGCTSLTNIEFPSVEAIYAYAFRDCTSLASVEFPSVTYIADNAFYGCTKLTSLILHKRAIAVATNVIPSQTIVYVESADLDWYSTAVNWSTIYANGRIKPISELPE